MTPDEKKRVEEIREKAQYTLEYYKGHLDEWIDLDPERAVQIMEEKLFLLSIIDRQKAEIKDRNIVIKNDHDLMRGIPGEKCHCKYCEEGTP